ncbi:MAG: hypothetical protein GY906_30525 [bacterium]|nr:hypothetical protein [bacterium]
MPCGTVVLVEPGLAGNIGGTIRVSANFGVEHVHLVRPSIDPAIDEVKAWACGGDDLVDVRCFDKLEDAVSSCRCLVATASARGRDGLPVVSPTAGAATISERGASDTAILFGNETSGLCRDHLDRCDLVVRVPTQARFPVLNLAQSVGILLAALQAQGIQSTGTADGPASQERVAGLMQHLEESLLVIGFLDPANPPRILRKLRRFFGRAGISDNEVDILRGICRQMLWAASKGFDGSHRFDAMRSLLDPQQEHFSDGSNDD